MNINCNIRSAVATATLAISAFTFASTPTASAAESTHPSHRSTSTVESCVKESRGSNGRIDVAVLLDCLKDARYRHLLGARSGSNVRRIGGGATGVLGTSVYVDRHQDADGDVIVVNTGILGSASAS